MNENSLEFDVISVEQNNLQSFIVFEVNSISSILQQTNVGQFVRSSPFKLNFPASIGKSKWILLLFPNGQYVCGHPNDEINIYLKLLYCENQSTELKFDIKFQLGYEYAKIEKKDQRLCFANAKTRWIGTKLIAQNEMLIHFSHIVRDDALVLSAHLDEHLPSMEWSYNCSDNYSLTRQSYQKSENKTKDLQHTSSPEKASYENSLWMNKEPYDAAEKKSIDAAEIAYNFWMKRDTCNRTEGMTIDAPYNTSIIKKESFVLADAMTVDLPKRSSIPSTIQSNSHNNESHHIGSDTPSGSAYSRGMIRDSNYNEYSDDENVPTAPTKSKRKNFFFGLLKKFYPGK